MPEVVNRGLPGFTLLERLVITTARLTLSSELLKILQTANEDCPPCRMNRDLPSWFDLFRKT